MKTSPEKHTPKTEVHVFIKGAGFRPVSSAAFLLISACGISPGMEPESADSERAAQSLAADQHFLVGDWNHSGMERPGFYNSTTGILQQSHDAYAAVGYQSLQLPAGITKLFFGDWWNEGVKKYGYRDATGMFHLQGKASRVPPIKCGTGCPSGDTCDTTDPDPNFQVCIPPGEVTFYVKNAGGSNVTTGVPVSADWDGDGGDDVGVFDNGTWYTSISKTSLGANQYTISFGQAGDIPVTGDWNGNGSGTFGLFRPDTRRWFLRDYFGGYAGATNADYCFSYGTTGDLPVTGSWDGNMTDSVGVFRAGGAAPNTWILNNKIVPKAACLTTNAPASLTDTSSVYQYVWAPPASNSATPNPTEALLFDRPNFRIIRMPTAQGSNWNATPAWNFNPTDSQMNYFTDFKVVNYGRSMVTSSRRSGTANGVIASIRLSDKAVTFKGSGYANWHSAERLPDANIAAVATAEDLLRVYDTTATTGTNYVDYTVTTYGLRDPHGVTWDPARGVLWVWGCSTANSQARLIGFKYNFNRTSPALTFISGASFDAPYVPGVSGIYWGHDLQGIPGTDRLIMSGSSQGSTEFDVVRGKYEWYRTYAPYKSNTKSINKHPSSKQLMLSVYASATDDGVDSVEFYNGNGTGAISSYTSLSYTLTRTGMKTYKARYNMSIPTRNGGF